MAKSQQKHSGQKRKYRTEIIEKLKLFPIDDRSVERLSGSDAVAEGALAMVTARIKPIMTAQNKFDQIEHVLSYIDDSRLLFEGMDNVVHVDEKCYLLFPGEEQPHRTRKSKRFMPKTIYDMHRKCTWNGKLGLWSLTVEYIAQRTSQNRPKDTVYIIELVNRAVCKTFLLDFVTPYIKSIQNRVPIHGIDNLITAVKDAFETVSAEQLDIMFLTLQSCMLCILREKGGNGYPLPHIGKEKLRKKDMLLRVLSAVV
ncbi:hypothetical protein PHMEG_00021705 [Phytophthora megakarya]|uniref:Uncharacterized protein n=1 Tax=Phytophthora megakarya TaxID=4795 RepID=A0A225VKZ2_9STRA|nr:hypothetical protein PHMEG_00021705 [Phytophthora megakarya]